MSKFLFLQKPLPSHWAKITYGSMAKRPAHYYVYAWMDTGRIFYVGCGNGLRAWAVHRGPCQEQREGSKKFRVLILKQNLSKREAHLEERKLIVKHNPLCNIRKPNSVYLPF